MSCSIPRETKGFIFVAQSNWAEFVKCVEDHMTDVFVTETSVIMDSLDEIEMLCNTKFLSESEYWDLINYCDVADFSIG